MAGTCGLNLKDERGLFVSEIGPTISLRIRKVVGLGTEQNGHNRIRIAC